MRPCVLNASRYTGKERDTESGLDYFGARYNSSSMGRFMSPDPLGGHLEDPQTLNKYSYVANNPLSRTDPTGLDFNLTGCGSTNTATCNNNMVGTSDANGRFTATIISNNKAGNLVDQAGNQYSQS
ncbi:MAG: RHS repeat-associated core domain-containing protein [Acidobacteriaceae bacterium]